MGRKRTAPNSEVSLTQLLDCRYNETIKPKVLSLADGALLAEQFADAARLYEFVANPSLATQAKHGFCLAMKGDDAAAEKLLTLENVGDHPVAKAVLAWVLGGRQGRRLYGFGNEAMKQRRATVQALLDSALTAERTPSLVFMAAFEVLGTHTERAAKLARRARQFYPDWAWPHAIVVRGFRAADMFEPAVFEDLMRTLGTTRHEECFHEAYVNALRLERWDDADRTVEVLEALVCRDPQQGNRNVAVLAEMRAMVALHRARDGEPEMYEQIPVLLAPFLGVTTYAMDGCDPLTALKFLLQVALETRNADNTRDVAKALIDRVWLLQGCSDEDLDSWNPLLSTPSLEGILHFQQHPFDFAQAGGWVELGLRGETRDRWRLLLAVNAVMQQKPAPEHVQLLREARDGGVPRWLERVIYAAHVEHEPKDLAGGGAMLVSLAEREQGIPPSPGDEGIPSHLAMFAIDLHEPDEVVEIFEGAFAWLKAMPTATGQVLLREWGDCLADKGGKDLLARIAALSLSRVDSSIARKCLARAQEPDDEPPTDLEEALARYPDPATTRVQPDALTLLEAATLIALLRASTLDHVHWTLSPLHEAAQRFEPTRKFIGTLFGLMSKGVIAVDASTPAGVIEFREGRLHAYLDRVIWRISAYTLELHRAIRALPHRDWPGEWRSHAPVLARDLGVEELAVYLEYLLDDRSLPIPDMEEVRGIFRIQLEQLAVAQCYYLAHKTMKEVLDYQARHHPGVKQLQARVINLLRGNGEKAIAHQWDTRYKRIQELPPSLLYEALHDVLTGWGQAAFQESVMILGLEDSGKKLEPQP